MQNDDGQQAGMPPAARGGRAQNGPHGAESRAPVVRRSSEPVEPNGSGGPVELVPTYRLPPIPPPPPSRMPLAVVALVVALLVVIGVLVGVLLTRPGSGGTGGESSSLPTTPPPTSAPRVPTAAGPTPSAARPTATVAPTAVPAVSDQVRVTPGGQDLDLLNEVGDRNEDVQFSPSSDSFDFDGPTARWTGPADPTAEDCDREVQRQPLSANERQNLSNNPRISVCTLTSAGNLAYVTALGAAEGDGVQVAVMIWRTG